jgi:hypothetical protein
VAGVVAGVVVVVAGVGVVVAAVAGVGEVGVVAAGVGVVVAAVAVVAGLRTAGGATLPVAAPQRTTRPWPKPLHCMLDGLRSPPRPWPVPPRMWTCLGPSGTLPWRLG